MPIAKSFSSHFRISPIKLMKFGCFDPILNFDTRLFIDPLLLRDSSATEFSDQASDLFQKHFAQLFELMLHSQDVGDPSWEAAAKRLRFPEIRFTCLGYGAKTTRGSSFGPDKERRVLAIAQHVSEVGIRNPYILPLYSLLEKDIGPDLISDMTTNVILPAVCDYTKRTCQHFGVSLDKHVLKGYTYDLPTNPYDSAKGPVLLLPNDILKELPVASSWEEAIQMASQNDALREQLNRELGDIFKDAALSENEKRKARIALLGSTNAFELFSEFLTHRSMKSYDFSKDPAGLMILQRLASTLPSQIPLTKIFPAKIDGENLAKAVDVVIAQFKHLVEKKGYWKELWANGKPKRESAAQRLFYAVAFAYIEAHGIDLNAEPDIGGGRIDFKASVGADRVVIEIKKSTNGHLIPGLESQLVEYCVSEKASVGYYLVLDCGGESWLDKLTTEANRLRKKHKIQLEIVPVDAGIRRPPSKTKVKGGK